VDILYLLIPLSTVLALGILGVFAWALRAGQFDDLEQQAEWILEADAAPLDPRQGPDEAGAKELQGAK
jgi:cbb3-type cytochrome oxidase maturation protein